MTTPIAPAGSIIRDDSAVITVVTGTATRTADAFSTTAEQTNTVDSNEMPTANAYLTCSFSVAPTEGSVHLFRRALNRIGGSNDAPEPSASYLHEYMGSFPVDDVTTQQYSDIEELPLLMGDQSFYIQNGTNQTMDSDYVVSITPTTLNTK